MTPAKRTWSRLVHLSERTPIDVLRWGAELQNRERDTDGDQRDDNEGQDTRGPASRESRRERLECWLATVQLARWPHRQQSKRLEQQQAAQEEDRRPQHASRRDPPGGEEAGAGNTTKPHPDPASHRSQPRPVGTDLIRASFIVVRIHTVTVPRSPKVRSCHFFLTFLRRCDFEMRARHIECPLA